MDSVLKETRSSAPAAKGKGKRSAIPVPITITAVDKDGQSFREDSRTLVITRHGMMVETIHRLNLGAEITVENPALGRTSTGRVVWCGTAQSASQVSEIGIYLTDAEVLCGVELAPEETERHPSAKPEGHRPENPPASASPQPSGAPTSEQAASLGASPAEPLVREPAEDTKPLAYRAEGAHVQELDLTSELGRVEAVSRGSNSPTFPVLDELMEPRGGPGPTKETFALPPLVPVVPVGSHPETPLPVERLNAAVEASLSLLEKRIGEIVPAQFGQFEQKLEVLAQHSVSLVEARLQESVSGLEPKIADLVERETASLTDRLRGAHVEVEGLLTRLEELREQVHTGLPASVAREEEEYAAELELRMEGTLARHLAAAEDRLQGSRAAAESLLGQIEEIRQKTHANLQELAARPAQESSALVEQSVTAAVDQHLSSLGERLQNFRAEVEGLSVRLEEQRQRVEGGLEQSASRLEGESAARLEQRMTAALDQQLASVADRLKGSSAEVEGLLARLEEQRQRVEGGLEESAARLEGESAARLEQRMTAALDQQLASVADRLKGSSAEVEGLLARLEEQRQRVEGGLEESASRLEGESAARLEQRMTAALDQQLASVADRLKGSSAEVEGLLARLEEQRQRAEGGLEESASRLEGESAARLEQRMTAALDQQLASVADRLKGSSAEVEGLLARLEEQRQRAEGGLEESAARLEGESAARLEQRMTAALDQQLASVADRLKGSSAEVEVLLARLEEQRQRVEGGLEESALRLEGESAARLEQRMTATLDQQLASVADRLKGSSAEVEGLLARLEEQRQRAEGGLEESASRLEGESAARLEQRMTAALDQQLASVADRLKGSEC